jgi:benzoate membrane transport protein
MIRDLSIAHVTAGFVAVLVGFTSSVVIVLQAADAAGASSEQISSWLWALGIGMGLTSIGLSLYYRSPILTAWSTPGAALLATSLNGLPMGEIIAAFMCSALLMVVCGVTGWFEKIMSYVPVSLGAAMLAGVLLTFGKDVFVAMEAQFFLVFTMFILYLLLKRYLPRYAILIVLVVGILLSFAEGLLVFDQFSFSLASPVYTAPVFSWSAIVSIGIPLFIVTMTSQNVPGIAVIRASGYNVPASPMVTTTGLTTLLLSPFGGYALNLAAITAAICMGKEAGEDASKRYLAAVSAGVFYVCIGLLGATIVALFAAFPKALVLAIAGLALLSTIANSLYTAMEDVNHREPALITFLVTISGMTLLGIGAAFWGLVAGVLAKFILSWRKT